MRVITFTIRFSYIFYLLHVASAVGDTLSLCDAEAKGKRILGFITGDLPDDQRSGFPDGIDEANFANDLKTQGWTFGSDANTGDVTGAIDMLGLDDSMAATIAVDNNQPAGDVPPTGASYFSVYDTKNGAIGGESLESPASKRPNGPLPALQNWSDLTFVLWKHKCAQNNAEINSIKTIVIVIVANKPSASVIGELIPDLSELGTKAGTGKTFTPDANDDEFNALMGIPFGQGVGYFLAQHKTSFPGKTVKSVEVIRTGKNPSLIYNLG